MRSMLQNDLGSYVQDAISAGAASSAAGLQKVLEIQRDWILNKAAGISENFDYSYGTSPNPLHHDHSLPTSLSCCFTSPYLTNQIHTPLKPPIPYWADNQAPPSDMIHGTSSPSAEVQ